ncbi:MAG TPA: dihydroorotase family protein [Actinomycetota bacterium]|nr:dihydroorotase family protein [Actinomycetota bacterium]
MSELDLGVLGAVVVTPSGRARRHLYVRQGRVAALTPERLDASRTVDATGLYLLPGMVDTHVHLMDPGPTEREDFPTGTAAAAANGVTTIVEHTHAHPVRTVRDLDEKRRYLRGRAHVDHGLAAHVWPDQIGRLGELWAAGAAFFKIFTCTTHGVPGLDAARLLAALEDLSRAGATALIHCEDESLTEEAGRALREAGRQDGAVLFEWRSREAELVAAQTAALLTGITGARATIAHVSHPAVADRVAAERAAGADVAAEACPQYFLLREHEVLDKGAFRKFTPPARARTGADEEAMWARLRGGVLTHVSTDHAPATREQKGRGIWEAEFGLPGLDTTLRLLIDTALRGGLALEDVVRVYAERPARRYGLWPRKGTLAVGADADLVLVDPEPTSVLRDEEVISKAGWTPYAGRQVRGAIRSTYLRGELLAEDRRLVRGLGGRFLPGPGAPTPSDQE